MNKENQMLTNEKAYPGSLSSRMRTRSQESCVIPPYRDCYTSLISNTWWGNRASSLYVFSYKRLQSSWVLLPLF